MTCKNYALIPALAAIILIPQLLFWWLAPASASAWTAVYIGGTILTIGIPAACFLAYWKSNIRETAGVLLVSGILDAASIGICVLLLAIDATSRSAIFALVIMILVSMIFLVPMISAALRPKQQGIVPISVSNVSETAEYQRIPVPARRTMVVVEGKPLPPRNR